MRCSTCGKINPDDVLVCTRCNSLLDEAPKIEDTILEPPKIEEPKVEEPKEEPKKEEPVVELKEETKEEEHPQEEIIDVDDIDSPVNDFNKEFIYSNQANFNSTKISKDNKVDNSGGAVVPDDPSLGVGFDDDDTPKRKKKKKSNKTPLSNIIIFASSLVAVIIIIFLVLLLVLGRTEYIHTYICSNYYDNMPPKEFRFNINFELRKDNTFILKIDEDNSVEGNYEVLEEATDGKNNRYTIDLKASKRTLGGVQKNDDYDERYNLTFIGEDTYLESTTSDFKYICKITE